VRSAVSTGSARLRQHARARAFPSGHGGEARRPQRAHPVVTLVALQIPASSRARHHRADLPHPRHRSLLISSILANDTPVIMAITFVFSWPGRDLQPRADLLYGWLDPRIAYR